MKIKLLKTIIGPSASFKIIETKIEKKKWKINILEFPKTVGILPLLEKNKIVLVKQYRFPARKELWEIPAGKLERNEDPKKGAERELKEETGFEAKKLEKIAEFYPSPGYSSEYMYLFRAINLKKGKQNLDEGEKIEKVTIFSLKETLKMIKKRKIIDAKTIIAICVEFFRSRRK